MRKVLNRFSLARQPFTREVAPEDLLDRPDAKEAQTRLKAAIVGKASAALTGDCGVGKTFMLRALETKLNPSRYRVTYICNSGVNRRDFYRQLCMGLGLEAKANAAALFSQVSGHMEELASEQKVHPVLAIDDAHLLPVPVLEHLHALLNYQRDSRSFLSLLLIGLPELQKTLARTVLASLSTRIPVRVHLQPMDSLGLMEYLHHRLRIDGCDKEVFSEDAVLCIREATGGVLRKVNSLAWECLQVVVEGKGTLIDGGIVQSAVPRCAEALR